MRSLLSDDVDLRLLQFTDERLFEEILRRAEREFEEQEHHSIVCRACSHTITSVENMISVNGQHHHTFINRADISFEIGCFSLADGCTVFGTPTLEDTWFAGYTWSYAACANCMIHLGWFYQGTGSNFFGLILDRLSETIRTH